MNKPIYEIGERGIKLLAAVATSLGIAFFIAVVLLIASI